MAGFGRDSSVRVSLLGVGSSDPFPTVPTTRLSWNGEPELLIGQSFDTGIMPLPDGPFERGKYGYKLVQYMTGGLPVIASLVGVNNQIVEHDINGYLANSTDDWICALRALKQDTHKRYEMGQAGRHKAEKMYNLQMAAPKLFSLLSNA